MLLTTATQGLSQIHHLFMTRHILNFSQFYNPLMAFIDPNWDTNHTHEAQDRVSEIHDPRFLVLGLGLGLKCVLR